MNFYNQKNILHEDDISSIKNKISQIVEKRNIKELIIKDYIFTILESVCKVLYYPIEDKVYSFYMKIDDTISNERFVFINTNAPYEKQVFAAAHELAHILNVAKDREEVLTSDLFYPTNINLDEIELDEIIADRFTSEFLVPNDILEEELKIMGMDKLDSITLEGIVKLMDKFLFPYKQFVIRLHDLQKLSNIKFEELLSFDTYRENNPIVKLQQSMGLCLKNNEVTKTKKFADFIDLTIESYNKTVRTYDKLEYLLKIFDLKPTNLNVKKKKPNYLSEKEFELQRIFEEGK